MAQDPSAQRRARTSAAVAALVLAGGAARGAAPAAADKPTDAIYPRPMGDLLETCHL